MIYNQKKARLISFVFFICLQIGQICYSQPVVVKKNNFNHDGSVDTKDWIFSVFEDDEGSFISAGYATKIIAGAANSIRPSLVKVDEDLEDVWHQNIDAGWNPAGKLRSISPGAPLSYAGLMNDAIQYTDPDDGIQYYVAVGHSYFDSASYNKLIIVKTTRDGVIVPTFPRVYMNTPGNNVDTAFANQTRHGRSIVYTKSGETGFFYIAGQENDTPCIFRLNEDLSFGSLTKIVTLPNTPNPDKPNLGELLSITFQYPDGANPKGNPNTPDQEPTYVWATGLGRNLVVGPQFKDSCILITKVKISGLSPFTIDQTWYENSPTPPSFPLDNWEIGGGDWGAHSGDPWYDYRKDIGKSTCLATYRQRSGGDLGTGIRQLYNGNMIVTGKANLIFSGYGTYSVPQLCTPTNADYWRDCDIFARIIDADNFPTTGLPSVGGYEIASRHIGHASGMEYFPQVRQNSDGDLYFMASNGDSGTVKTHTSTGLDLLTNFHVIKTDSNLNVLWTETFRSEETNSPACGFAADICRNDELVVGGDNKHQADNYDFIRLSRDCEKNYTGYTTSPNYVPSSLDDPTISVLALKGSTGTWNITSNTKIKGRLVIENGCTVHVNGATVEFADMDQLTDVDNVVANSLDYGIEVEPGGKLILSNGAILTSSAACESYWRGVHLQASSTPDQSTPSTIGILEMDDSRIQNAICGVSVEGGGLITCTNTDSASYDNFLNNRKGVAFYPFSTANASSFNTVNFNFISPSAVKDFGNIGLNTHCSMYGVENVIFNGCSFKNEYTGPFRLGFGLASFDATYQVLNGNDITVSQPCGPIGRNSTFENLAIGIISDRTPSTSPTNFIGVAEADFINCGIAWQCDQDVSPLMYKNNITWNDDLDDYPMPNGIECIGYRSDSTIDSKLHENTFSTSGSLPYGYGIMVYDGGNSVKSLVRNNTFTKNTGTNQFHSGIWTAYDNDLFELKCNKFNNMSYYDWYNNGTMNTQGTTSISHGNEFSSSISNNIYSVYGSFTYYFATPENPTGTGYASTIGGVPINNSCNYLDPCDVYSNVSTTIDDKFVLNSLPMPLMLKKPEELIWENIRNKNFDEASDLTNQLPEGDYKDFLNIAIDILSTKRETNPTQKEVESLKKIALTENEASINARHFLSFFLGILIPTKMEDRLIPETQKATPGLNTMKELNRLMVYPNPTTGLVTFEWSNEPHAGNIKTISIMDISGKVVVELNNLGAAMKQEIDFKSQPNGIYFYKIMDEKGNFKTGKLSISK